LKDATSGDATSAVSEKLHKLAGSLVCWWALSRHADVRNATVTVLVRLSPALSPVVCALCIWLGGVLMWAVEEAHQRFALVNKVFEAEANKYLNKAKRQRAATRKHEDGDTVTVLCLENE